MTQTEPNFRVRVEELVRQIPKGRLMTYGQLAALCGNARAARVVGGIAHFSDPSLPWQRVVNKQGGLASGYPGGRAGHKQVLEAEGFKVSKDYKVDIDRFIWWPSQKTKAFDKFITIVGETTSGKSALAMQLAEIFDGEIICADSVSLRRGLNIGSAKPSDEDRSLIPHYLVDIIGPDEKFTVANFKKLAEQAILQIQSRSKLPILVGGTGLYIDAVLYDYKFSILDARDRQAIREDCRIIGLKVDRQLLKSRIKDRLDKMITAGLEDEVRDLVNKYGWDCIGLKNIGYRQWQSYFDGSKSLAETQHDIFVATCDIAKRQRTWFKRNNSIQWIDTPVNLDSVVDILTTYLST